MVVRLGPGRTVGSLKGERFPPTGARCPREFGGSAQPCHPASPLAAATCASPRWAALHSALPARRGAAPLHVAGQGGGARARGLGAWGLGPGGLGSAMPALVSRRAARAALVAGGALMHPPTSTRGSRVCAPATELCRGVPEGETRCAAAWTACSSPVSPPAAQPAPTAGQRAERRCLHAARQHTGGAMGWCRGAWATQNLLSHWIRRQLRRPARTGTARTCVPSSPGGVDGSLTLWGRRSWGVVHRGLGLRVPCSATSDEQLSCHAGWPRAVPCLAGCRRVARGRAEVRCG